LIGHDKQKKYFASLIKNKALGNAYIFTGPEMIGKKTFALELAKTLFGDDFHQNPDFKLIAPKIEDDESKIYPHTKRVSVAEPRSLNYTRSGVGIYIEDIRDLKKNLSLKSYSDGYRLVVFNDAHSLTPEASNAFLKLLEEPPIGSTVILVSSMPGLLPATILSRCEEVRFTLANQGEVLDYLSEQKKMSNEDKDFIAKLSGGRIGLVDYLLEKKNLDNAKKAVEDLRKLFKTGIYERMEYVKKINDKGDYGRLLVILGFCPFGHIS
jgi:DNA polymerase-3 subunit delta'